MTDDLLAKPLADLAAGVRNGSWDAQDLMEQSQARIAQTDANLHAWVALAPDVAEQANDRDARRSGPLAGIPLGVKDLIDVAGVPTRCGSPTTSAEPVASTAMVVQTLTRLGAVVAGKTVTTEFAYFAPGPTANPRDLARTPGGSSSGSAAAVAAGQVPLALGTQTAGSVIRPASYCGVAGWVPTFGALDRSGVLIVCPSLDTPGLFTRTVADLATVVDAMFPELGVGPADAEAGVGVVLRVRCWQGSALDTMDPQMTETLERAVELLRDGGHEVEQLDWDEQVQTLSADHAVVMAYEMAEQLSGRLQGHGDQISHQLADLLRSGSATPQAVYRAAMDRRDHIRATLAGRLGDDELILGPATPGPAPLGLSATGPPSMNRPWQALGWPQLAIPGATTSDGLPLGLQLIGRPGQECSLLRLGQTLEQALIGEAGMGQVSPVTID